MRKTAVIILCLLALSCNPDKGGRQQYPVPGRDALQVRMYETQPEAYAAWSEAGLREVALVIMSSYLRLGDALSGSTVDSGFLRRVISEGVVDQIYWVVPEILFSDVVTAEGDIQQYLAGRETGLDDDEIQAMRFQDGCLAGRGAGAMIHVCNASNLPSIAEPVLLLVDASFFPVYADTRGLNKLGALSQSLDSIFKRGYRAAGVSVSYSVRDGRTRPIHRPLGDVAARVLGFPDVMAEAPPALWQVRDRAELLFVRRIDADLAVTLADSLERYPGDPVLGLINASSMIRRKEFEGAIAIAEGICRREAEYCIGLQYLGYLAGLAGEHSWAERFYGRARELGITLPGRLYYANPGQGGR